MPQIIEITDLSRPELDAFCRLTEAQLRNRLEPEKGVFIAESPTVIGLALDAGYEPLALLTERKFIEGKAAGIIARCGEIPLYTGEREVLARLTGYELTRGVLCAMRRPRPKDFREVCAGTRRVAVLENVVDSTNVGAIIRSAAALGIDAVLLTPSCCDPLNRRAVRVSMGTVFQIPWAYIGEQPADWPSPGLDWLNELGFKTAAMALREDSLLLNDPLLMAAEKLAVVRERAAARGRTLQYGIRLHVIVRETEEEAWAAADRLIAHLDDDTIAQAQKIFARMDSAGQARMSALHQGSRDNLRIAPNLWAGVGLVRGGAGTALVGNPQQVAERIREYQALGISNFIFSGYPHLEEAHRFAELVMPLLPLENAASSKARSVNTGPFGETIGGDKRPVRQVSAS